MKNAPLLSPRDLLSLVASKLFDFVFEAFPRLHQAKGPKRERQVLSSDKERVEQPPSLFTTDQSYAQDSANLQHYILLRDKLATHAVIRATTDFNLQCNNVARQVEGKCCPFYRTLKAECQHIQSCINQTITVNPANSWDEHLENLVSIQHLYWIRNTFSLRSR